MKTPPISLPARRTVVVATNNKGKLLELRRLLAHLPLQLLSLGEAMPGKRVEVVEDGDSFEANALKKAREVAHLTSLPTIADDSGLEVDALEGAPGVRSARYAGERATDAENNRKLLDAFASLAATSAGSMLTRARTARFRCVVALVDPAEPLRPRVAEGRCEGLIAGQPSGTGGFGYDPIFLVYDYPGKTMAELTDAEKDAVSHRGAAVRALEPKLRDWLGL